MGGNNRIGSVQDLIGVGLNKHMFVGGGDGGVLCSISGPTINKATRFL